MTHSRIFLNLAMHIKALQGNEMKWNRLNKQPGVRWMASTAVAIATNSTTKLLLHHITWLTPSPQVFRKNLSLVCQQWENKYPRNSNVERATHAERDMIKALFPEQESSRVNTWDPELFHYWDNSSLKVKRAYLGLSLDGIFMMIS